MSGISFNSIFRTITKPFRAPIKVPEGLGKIVNRATSAASKGLRDGFYAISNAVSSFAGRCISVFTKPLDVCKRVDEKSTREGKMIALAKATLQTMPISRRDEDLIALVNRIKNGASYTSEEKRSIANQVQQIQVALNFLDSE